MRTNEVNNSNTGSCHSINSYQDNVEEEEGLVIDGLKVVVRGLSAQDLWQPVSLSGAQDCISDALDFLKKEQAMCIQYDLELQLAPELLGVELSYLTTGYDI